MGIRIAAAKGAINKAVNSIHVFTDGNWKEVKNGYVFTDGNWKKFYSNWIYKTGTTLASSSGGGSAPSTLNPSRTDEIRLQKCKSGASVESMGVNSSVTLKLEWYNGSDYELLGSQTKTLSEGDVSSLYVSVTLPDSENYQTDSIRARLILNYGNIEYSSFYVQCTEWYERG